MFDTIEKLKIISALYGTSAIHKRFTSRPYHALIFKIDGESEYVFEHNKLRLTSGQVLFIPQGATYTVNRVSADESHYALINFTADIPNNTPFLIPSGDFTAFRHTLDHLIKLLLSDEPSDKFESISLFYRIISALHLHQRRSYCDPDKRLIIRPATEHLENNIFDSQLKVTELHNLCSISDTYFRQLFIKIHGVSPKKYILRKRLTQAKNILDSGDYIHVYDVASSVGFTDPLYFSKVFKEAYGYYPSASTDKEKKIGS